MYNYWLSIGRETDLINAKNELLINKYVACLILGGYGTRAREFIDSKDANITSYEATALRSICKDDFKNMKESVETYELLVFLGAEIEPLE